MSKELNNLIERTVAANTKVWEQAAPLLVTPTSEVVSEEEQSGTEAGPVYAPVNYHRFDGQRSAIFRDIVAPTLVGIPCNTSGIVPAKSALEEVIGTQKGDVAGLYPEARKAYYNHCRPNPDGQMEIGSIVLARTFARNEKGEILKSSDGKGIVGPVLLAFIPVKMAAYGIRANAAFSLRGIDKLIEMESALVDRYRTLEVRLPKLVSADDGAESWEQFAPELVTRLSQFATMSSLVFISANDRECYMFSDGAGFIELPDDRWAPEPKESMSAMI